MEDIKMAKGDLELQKNKKPVEIKVTRDAEDVVQGPNVAFMLERPAELNYTSEIDAKKIVNNPLVNREAKRRKAEGGLDAEMEYYVEMADKSTHEIIDQAEKNWISGEMEKLQKKAEERRKEEERIAREEQERKEREEQERLEREEQERLEEERKAAEAEERKVREEKERKERKERERLYVEDNLHMTERRLSVHLPEKTALSLKYESKFSYSVNDKKRKEKQKNKKSRLYQKLQNARLLKSNITQEHNVVYERASEQITKDDDISAEDFNDMAQFMMYKDKYRNQQIAELMLGGKNAEGHRCVDEYHAHLALTRMADQLLGLDVTGIRMDTDHDIAVNALQLEGLANRLAAFTRLSAKYNYMQSLDMDRRQALHVKLVALRSVAAYYTMRKEIITDPLYKEHYDHELSMDVTKTAKGADAATADAQRALAEKLVKSYILGRNMLRINGVSLRDIDKKMPEPRFKNAAATEFYNNTKNELNEIYNEFGLIDLVRDGYTATDEKASQTLADIKEGPAMREEARIILNQPIETEAEAEHQQKMAQETGFADGILKTLLTSDELIPLKGTRQMAAVKNNIQALQAFLTNTMPGVKIKDGEVDEKAEAKARKEIDQTCIAVVMLYKRMTDSIDSLVKKYGSAYSDVAAMLTGLSDQCKKESESFREKTLEYRSIVTQDEALRSAPRTWMDAVKFNRGMFYDLDNDASLSVKMDGAGASTVYKITKTVPVSASNPHGEEVVYFRAKDSVPPADDKELISAVLARHEVSEDTAKTLTKVLRSISGNSKMMQKLLGRMKQQKVDKRSAAYVASDFISAINKGSRSKIDIPPAEYETVGHILMDWRDDVAKRIMAHDMSISAKIECGRNLSDRNVATSRLATLFGIQSMICDSRTATVRMNGQIMEGNLMENTGGTETSNKPRPYTQKAISQIFMMNTFDFICGQTDRHFSNFHAKVLKGNYDQVRCLDNDMAFGNIKATDIGDRSYNRIMPMTDLSIMGLPVAFVNRMMAIDRPYLDQVLGDILNKAEIDALMDRLDFVKLRVIALADERKDAKWDAKTRQFSYTGLMADDAYRQLWSVEQLRREAAMREDNEMGWISKFLTDNVRVTPIKDMMRSRKAAIEGKAQKGKKK